MNTITDLDPLANDQLGQRLTRLTIATPPYPHEVRARRSLVATRRVVRRGGLAVSATLSLCLANGVAAYFLPAYAAALASAPIISAVSQPALDIAGLSAGEVRPINQRGSLNGVTVTLAGGYADGVNTTLFLQLDGITKDNGFGGLYLTDQFGQRYDLTGGVGIGVGAYPAFFQPLRGAAAQVGARLTLHAIVGHGLRPEPSGEIQLHATLLANSAKRLATPQPIVSEGSTYSVLGLEYSNNAIAVHTRMSGQLIEADLTAEAAIKARHSGGVSFPGVYLVDPSGRYQTPIANENAQQIETILQREHALDETRIFTLSAPGTYRIVISVDDPGPAAHSLAEWTIRIP